MGRLRRLISVTFATTVAIGGALVFVPVACLVDPVTRSAGFALTEYALSVLSEDFPDGPADSDLVLFGRFVWGAAVLVCALPVIVVALVGEMTGTRRTALVCRRNGFRRRFRAVGHPGDASFAQGHRV